VEAAERDGMTVAHSRIRSDTESDIHDEPHIEGSRITVQHIRERVEGRELQPETVAERLNLSLAEVYEALAYYHRHPAEMQAVETHRQKVAADAETLERPE